MVWLRRSTMALVWWRWAAPAIKTEGSTFRRLLAMTGQQRLVELPLSQSTRPLLDVVGPAYFRPSTALSG
jgi:hypothetical protein